MLEFMDVPSVNSYHLNARIKDCEPNLFSFNFITPMAICLEAMIKLTYLEYAEEKHIRVSIYDLEVDQSSSGGEKYSLGTIIRKENFTCWLQEKYGISQSLIGKIKTLNTENNHYKHSLQNITKKSPEEKKSFFEPFYIFSAKYFEHKTGKKAPPWSEDEYNKLMAPEIEKVSRRFEAILYRR